MNIANEAFMEKNLARHYFCSCWIKLIVRSFFLILDLGEGRFPPACSESPKGNLHYLKIRQVSHTFTE